MAVSEGVSARVLVKPYASGDITANAEDALPGATGGQELRRVASTLSLAKDIYESEENRQDQQVGDMRHGVRRVAGAISGELSPATYFSMIEGVHRDTGATQAAITQTTLTSIVCDGGTASLTFGGGDPVAAGLRVGDVIRLTGANGAGNNGRNFTILSFGGTSNRTVTVHPAPATGASSTTFSVARPGKASIIPASGQVRRKWMVEHAYDDVDVSRVFKEVRFTSYALRLPTTGMATVEIGATGRNMERRTGAGSPYLTAPGAVTTTGITAAVNGLLRLGGSIVGTVTGLDITVERAVETVAVAGQNIVADILLGKARVSGSLTAVFDGGALEDEFINETELELIARLDASGDAASDAIAFHLPRIKLAGYDLPLRGEGAQVATLPFRALRYLGIGAGIASTSIRVCDTAAT